MDQYISIKRYFLILVLLVTVLFFPETGHTQSACQTNNDISCEVYTQCIEANCNCTKTSFPYTATFGPKYCQRFGSETGFGSLGRQWRDKTLICLKDRISSSYVSNSDASGGSCNCSAIQAAAIDSHSECYLSAPSFCKLSESDIRALARIVDSADIFALGAAGLGEMGHVLATCYWTEGLSKGDLITRAFVSETLEEGTEIASEVVVEVLKHAVKFATSQAQQTAGEALLKLYREYFPAGPTLQ